MLTGTKKAVGRTTAPKDNLHDEPYLNCSGESSVKRPYQSSQNGREGRFNGAESNRS